MKLWAVLIVLITASACSGIKQDQREGDTAPRFAEHRGIDPAHPVDAHLAKTSAGSSSDERGWVATVCGGIWDLLFNSGATDTSSTLDF